MKQEIELYSSCGLVSRGKGKSRRVMMTMTMDDEDDDDDQLAQLRWRDIGGQEE